MHSALRTVSLLILFLLTLTACAAPASMASAPTATPTLTARQQVITAAPSDRVKLAAGHYQLLMLYSPL
jgi:hypothetical protein